MDSLGLHGLRAAITARDVTAFFDRRGEILALLPEATTEQIDHAIQDFAQSTMYMASDDSDVNTTSLFESQAKFAESGHFPDRDVHGMSSSFLRRGVSNIYRAGDERYLHTPASFDPGATLVALGLPRDDPDGGSLEEGWRGVCGGFWRCAF